MMSAPGARITRVEVALWITLVLFLIVTNRYWARLLLVLGADSIEIYNIDKVCTHISAAVCLQDIVSNHHIHVIAQVTCSSLMDGWGSHRSLPIILYEMDQEKFAHDHKSRRARAALHATSHGQHYMARLGCKRQLKARVIHRNTFAEPSGLSTTGSQGVISSRNRVLGLGFRGRCRLPSRCHLEHVHLLRDSWVLKSYIMLLSSSASRSFDPKSVTYLYSKQITTVRRRRTVILPRALHSTPQGRSGLGAMLR